MGTLKVLVVEAGRAQRAAIVDALCELPGIEVDAEATTLDGALRVLDRRRREIVIAGPTLSALDAEDLTAAAYAAGARWVFVVDATRFWRSSLADLAATLTALARESAPAPLEPVEPLTSADLLLTGVARGARARERVRAGRAHQLRAGSRLATRLAAHARRGGAVVEAVDLPVLLRALTQELAPALPEGVEVSVICEHDPPRVRCVPVEIERLVVGSVLDASEGMPWGGTIWLLVDRDGAGCVRLEVLDTGTGVPSAIATRAKRRRSLESARPEIERHGGRLYGIHEPSGGWTTIQLLLPAA